MKRKSGSLISNLCRLAIIPLLCLGIVGLLVSSFSIYSAMKAETKDGLNNLAHAVGGICSLKGSGDYEMIDGVMTKGGKPFDSDFSIVDDIYRISGVDATIFFDNTRMLTSIRNPDGSRAVGTVAAPRVVQTVIEKGEDYFSDHVSVNNISYFGYYIPLRNSDQSIIGMVFVGKARNLVVHEVQRIIIRVFVILVAVIAVTSAIAIFYAKRTIYFLKKTKEFLGELASGNVDNDIDPYLLQRNDEIGEMGKFAVILQKSVLEMAGTDPLTGLHNRRSGGMALANSMEEHQRCQTPFVVVIGDIDDFKGINDQYGHQAGDIVLKKLSAIFIKCSGSKSYVARWGGEEFLFIFNRADKQTVLMYLKELSEKIESTDFIYNEQRIPVRLTYGVAECVKDVDVEAIIKRADDNLYYGKANGKNQIIS